MAKQHLVKCLYCGVTFDCAKEPFEKPRGNRYAHKLCYDKHMNSMSQEERDYEALVEYIKELLGSDINPRVWKQLKEYRTDPYNYTYSGILKTLQWWYDIKGNDVERANGAIGIVPYVYKDACNYYYALYLAAVANEDKDLEHYKVKVREFVIEPPTRIIKPPKLFNLDDLEEEENV
jgi:hypothetical protein